MKIYLKTLEPARFSEISQYIDLSGIFLDLEVLEKKKREALLDAVEQFLAVSGQEQKIFVPVIEGSFRSQLSEIRTWKNVSNQIVPIIAAVPEGCMALKACRTLKLEVLCGPLYTLGQYVLLSSVDNHFLLSLDQNAFHNHKEALLKGLAALCDEAKKNIIVEGIANQQDLLAVMEAGLEQIVLDYRQISSIFLDTPGFMQNQMLRESFMVGEMEEPDEAGN